MQKTRIDERKGAFSVSVCSHRSSQQGEQLIPANQVSSEATLADGGSSVIHYVDPVEGFLGYLAFAGFDNPLAAGGFRVQPGLTARTVERLARVMALKQWVLGLPVDGAKCGIAYDPQASDKSAAIRRFLAFVRPHLLDRFSMGPDMGTGFQEIEAHARSEGIPSVKIAIAKAQGLSEGEVLRRLQRLEMRVGDLTLGERRAGHALAHAAIATLDWLGCRRAAAQVGIQGFGTLGRAAAAALAEAGLPVTAVGDEHGCLVADRGLDVAALLRSRHREVIHPGHHSLGRIEPAEALFETVDVVLLAACEDAVDADARHALADGTRAVVVGANLGLSESSETWLHDRGVVVVPDFVGGCGGPASMDALFGPPTCPTPDMVLHRVRDTVRSLVHRVLTTSSQLGVEPRKAALLLCREQGTGQPRRPYGRRLVRHARERVG